MSSPVDIDQRFAPPEAHVEDLTQGGLELGSRWARLGAVLIDGLLQAVIFSLVSYLFLGRFMVVRLNDPFSFVNLLLQVVGSFVVFLLLQGYLLVRRGQTIGKRIVGLRIVRTDGSVASPGRILGLRYLLSWVLATLPGVGALYGLVDALAIFRASRQCLHDNLADTIVVKA